MISSRIQASQNGINRLLHPLTIKFFACSKRMASELCGVYSSHVEGDKIYLTMPMTNVSVPNIQVKEPNDNDMIPASVLNYERQLRKAQAAKKANTLVTKEEHLHVVYEDDVLVVVNKPSGILCVPGIHSHSSLLTIVQQIYAPTVQQIDRLVVHRLDMDTSGLVVFGRNADIVKKLHQIFRDRDVEKSYEALVCGHIQENFGRIDLPLQRDHDRPPFMRVSTPLSELAASQVVQDLQSHGWKKILQRRPKSSQTEFEVLSREYMDGEMRLPVTRLKLIPITGRTHQLRVHCAALGHPIVGDPTYGVYGEASSNGGIQESYMDGLSPNRASLELQKQIDALPMEAMCLHARKLIIKHPISGNLMTWEVPPSF
jgi:tRNA pseudouridine32 synthase / 23S rRNA pseudouridine746 synthase